LYVIFAPLTTEEWPEMEELYQVFGAVCALKWQDSRRANGRGEREGKVKRLKAET
jgi:hypothetical protein